MSTLPSTLGPYRILDVVDKGGFGVVYRATHQETGALVAIKTVRVPQEAMLRGIRREVRALARLHHPCVVRVLEEGVDNGLPWYAMELIQGSTLLQYRCAITHTSVRAMARAPGDLPPVDLPRDDGLPAARLSADPTPRDLAPDDVLSRDLPPDPQAGKRTRTLALPIHAVSTRPDRSDFPGLELPSGLLHSRRDRPDSPGLELPSGLLLSFPDRNDSSRLASPVPPGHPTLPVPTPLVGSRIPSSAVLGSRSLEPAEPSAPSRDAVPSPEPFPAPSPLSSRPPSPPPAASRQGAGVPAPASPAPGYHPYQRIFDLERLPAALAAVRKVCDALAYIHGESLVHRDLKPANILVRPDGSPVIIDFGLNLRFTGDLSREVLEPTLGINGTIPYMSPEQIRGDLLDARADLYSLGCILYELLTGTPPFEGPPLEVLRQHLEAPPFPPSHYMPGIPPALDALVLRLLAKHPPDRFGYASDVAAALARLGAEEPASSSSPPVRAYLYRPQLAGRDMAFRVLNTSLNRLIDRKGGRLSLVSGESGVGKTRLVLELARAAADSGLGVLTGECLQTSMAPGEALGSAAGGPLHPLRQPLQAIVDRCRQGKEIAAHILGPRAPLLARYEPEFATLPGVDATLEPATLDAPEARLRLFSYLTETLEAFAQPRPLLLILDDLQWIDELTLGFLRYLLSTGRLAASSLWIAGTFRSEEARDLLQPLLAAPGVEHLELERLNEPAIEALVGDMLALSPPPPAIVRFLARSSEGNPFFVSEYLRMAVDEGLLFRDGAGRWQLEAALKEPSSQAVYDTLPLPGSLRALVGRRLEGLPGDALRLAQAAAVVGREIDLPVLERMVALSEERGLDGLNELMRRQILEQSDLRRLRFVHDKIREVAYEGVPERSRPMLHRAAAEALEGLSAEPRDDHLAALGRHWQEAGELEKARGYYLAGARHAVSRYAHGEAERLYQACLALCPEASAERLAARLELARAVFALRGRNHEALAAYQASWDEARLLGDTSAEGAALQGLADLHWRSGHPDEAEKMCRAALELYRGSGARRAEAETLHRLGLVYLQRAQLAEAGLVWQEALALHLETGNDAGAGTVLNNLGLVHARQGRWEEALVCREQSLELRRRSGNRPGEARALASLAVSYEHRGEPARALELLEQALKIHAEVGDLRHEPAVLHSLVELYLWQGSFARAHGLLERIQAIRRQSDDRYNEGVLLSCIAVLMHHQGELEEAKTAAEQAIAIHQGLGGRQLEGLARLTLAAIHVDLGEPRTASLIYSDALRILREVREPYGEFLALLGLAALERRTSGGPERGERSQEAGPTRRFRGQLEYAERLLQEARGVFEALGNPLHLVLCACEQGHVAMAGGWSGRGFLLEARQLVEGVDLPSWSRPGLALTRLQRAVEAFETGASLYCGELVQDVPYGLIEYLPT